LLLPTAALAVAAWAAREATTPARPKFWVHAMVPVHDGSIRPLLGGEAGQEAGRLVLSDALLRDAAPGRDPEAVGRRIRVGVELPNRLWFHLETDSPEERAMLASIVDAYARTHDATVFFPVSALGPVSYPRAIPVATGAAALALSIALLAVARLALKRRSRRPLAGRAS